MRNNKALLVYLLVRKGEINGIPICRLQAFYKPRKTTYAYLTVFQFGLWMLIRPLVVTGIPAHLPHKV